MTALHRSHARLICVLLVLGGVLLFESAFCHLAQGEEQSPSLDIGIDRTTMVQGELFALHGNFSEPGNISFEIQDPARDTVYLKTVETNDTGNATMELKAPKRWEQGLYTVHAVGSSQGGEANDSIQFTLMVPLPDLRPDLSLTSQDIWLWCVGGDKNVSVELGGDTIEWSGSSDEQVFVCVRLRNDGNGKGTANLSVYVDMHNQSQLVGKKRFSLNPGSEDVIILPLPSRFLPEENNTIHILVDLEDITPADRNPLDNQMSRRFTVLVGDEDDPGSDELFPLPTVIVSAGITMTVVGVFVAGTDVGRYSFFSLLLPLYTRLKKDKLLDQFTRGKIDQYIVDHPGAHFSQIQADLEIGNGTLTYHLTVLERERLIKSRRDGRYKRFYPWKINLPSATLGSSEIERRIIEIIRERQESGLETKQKHLVPETQMSKQRVSYFVKKLKEKRVLGEGRVLKLRRNR